MNFKNTFIKSIFGEKEFKVLQDAILADTVIVDSLLKIFNKRKESREQINIDDPNWIIKRSMADGQVKEINWWLGILKTMGDSDGT